ncbi:ABC transporter permease [Ruania alba]|uniref:Peptide/nickel transport system permease protein n=1 Tax=Ruania alba TaxID=648782 RepID=A0A1H5HIS8_9MICO|nr:ABC transporter permease [Ruania alba]SEE27902.1 peptide/nickel transport system permease protein [Ruania alba]
MTAQAVQTTRTMAPAPKRKPQGAFRRLLRKPTGAFGLVVVGLLVATALAAPLITSFAPEAQIGPRLAPPGGEFILGTDQFGRDIFSRLVHGTRVSLIVGLVSVGVGATIGTIAGLISGYFGGWVDQVTGRAWDVVLAYPGILLGVLVVAIAGPSLSSVIWAVAIINVPIFARLVRSQALRERQLEYVQAAKVSGASGWRIAFGDVLPNCLAPVLVQVSVSMGFAILMESALSFLGLGTQPPDASWGSMLDEGRGFLREAPWFGFFPGLVLAVLLIALNFLSDALREVLDPQRGRN